MKNMFLKRILVLVLALTMIPLVACKDNTEPEPEELTDLESSSAADMARDGVATDMAIEEILIEEEVE